MRPVTTRIPDDTYGILEEIADARDESVSAVVRDLVEQGLDYDDLEQNLEQAEARIEDLRRQLQQANAGERDVDELVAYVEEEREFRRRRERREQRREQRRQANAFRRAWWWLAGEPAEDGMTSE